MRRGGLSRPSAAAVGLAIAVTLLATSDAHGVASGGPSNPREAVSSSAMAPGDHTIKLVVGHRSRSLILHVPRGAAIARRPLLLIFHGISGTAQRTEQQTDFSKVADRTGELVAFMQGYQNSWNEGTGNSPAARAHIDDVGYTLAAIRKLEGLVTFDRARIVAVGFSNGALMVEYLGCRIAGRLAMIVPVEGELAVTMSATCRPMRPISVYEVHGTADTAIRYGGGPINGNGADVLSAPRSIARWAHLDHCASRPATSATRSSIRFTTYSRCRSSTSVRLRTIVGGVHQWGSNIGQVVASVLPN